MSLRIDRLLLNRFASFINRVLELAQTKMCAAELEVSLREWGPSLFGRSSYRFYRSGQIAFLYQNSSELELSIGVITVTLLQCLSKRIRGLLKIAASR